MTLDEAIKHCEDVAEDRCGCAEDCVEEHRQLAEWLKELRERRAKDEPNLSEIPNSSTRSKMEQVDKDINVRSKWETPPKFDHNGVQTACVTVPAWAVEIEDESQISPSDCMTCKHDLWSTPRTCGKCSRQEDGKPSMYEPKDELQTERSE